LPGVFKAHEPVGVQAFRPQLAVERFDEGIIRHDVAGRLVPRLDLTD
jgi:hypothetical protein